ncbi:hypothetical protein MSG28_001450 [Choristoneura fumiferana]|uniref:Uncharacterized protein n=1 Tax=Choristoneura fumiferana TaxID=7141 RepID=A0ACC0KV27_CHOFU|nr:hypothetical protein MSG28_001450 [Choristoneura fumiferana]
MCLDSPAAPGNQGLKDQHKALPWAAQPASHFEEEIFYAYDNSKVCPQTFKGFSNTASEQEDIDCLQLSLYVPSRASSKNPLPVLVWIHGGGFAVGSGNQQGPSNLLKHGIIIVTVNYRLGPYGFMCLNNTAVPGNQGLKDQYTALRWVRDNIAAFGGNPYNDARPAPNFGEKYSMRLRQQ